MFLWQIELAFSAGYDPALELANRSHAKLQRAKQGKDVRPEEHEDSADWWDAPPLRRDDQDLFDDIVSGHEAGRYFMILGPKVRIVVCIHQSLEQLRTQRP